MRPGRRLLYALFAVACMTALVGCTEFSDDMSAMNAPRQGGSDPAPFEQDRIGVTYTALDPALAARIPVEGAFAAMIIEVNPRSPAAEAGLAPGDVITHVDGDLITSQSHLTQLIDTRGPGDAVSLRVVAGSESREVRVTLGTP
jgi:S1-C subfamily serine protease